MEEPGSQWERREATGEIATLRCWAPGEVQAWAGKGRGSGGSYRRGSGPPWPGSSHLRDPGQGHLVSLDPRVQGLYYS